MYERRMNRMCRILDEGSFLLKSSTPLSQKDNEWGVITKTQLFEYKWPRGGMFVWLRVLYESHPLWQHPWTSFAGASSSCSPSASSQRGTGQSEEELIGGIALSTALMVYLTQKPHLVLASTGALFSADDTIRTEEGWRYFRLCFAAVGEEELDASSRRFVEGVHSFWRVKDPKVIKKLLEPFESTSSTGRVQVQEQVDGLEERLCIELGQMDVANAWTGC